MRWSAIVWMLLFASHPRGRARKRAHLSRLVVGRRERRGRGCAVRSSNGPGTAEGTALVRAVRPKHGANGGPLGAAHVLEWRRHGKRRCARRCRGAHGLRLAARPAGRAVARQFRDARQRGGLDRGVDRVAQGRSPAEAAGALHERRAAAAADRENQQSLPSSHASLAFAAATSYLVLARRQHLPHRTRNAVLLYAGAVGVAALRVAAGKHFPTDVAAGAALGAGSAGSARPYIRPSPD